MALAADPGRPICPSRPIKFAFYQMGYAFSDTLGAHRTRGAGIDRDLLDEMIRRSGCRFTTAVYARARTWHDLETGDLDMASAAAETPERDKFAWFAFYMIGKEYLILMSDRTNKVRSMDDLLADRSLRLGVVRSFVHGDYFDRYLAELRAQGRVVEVIDQDALYFGLQQHQFDAILGLPFVYPFYFRKYDLDGQVQLHDLDPTPGLKHGIVMSNKRFSELEARRWRALIDGIRADGTLARIVRRYLDVENTRRILDF